MRNAFVFACLAFAAVTALMRQGDRAPAAHPPQPAAMTATALPPAVGPKSVTLRANGRQFETGAQVNGRRLDFVVDTGASMIALRESDAARAGIRVSPGDYTARTQTANGIGRAAPVQLARVDISGISIRDVEAFVMPDNALPVNLLGMSFLSRVKFSHDRGRLVIEQ
ncbi:MAG: TIGR02281 family clan AA aspartic protease [Pseudorhodoplanes sp.]